MKAERNPEKLKKNCKAWASETGPQIVSRHLILAGLSPTLAQKLVSGNYYSEPKDRVIDTILSAMKIAKATKWIP